MSRWFGPIRQNGYVVRDLDAAIEHWVAHLGVGPWFVFDEVPIDWFRYRGVPSSPRMSIALANSGELQIELIQCRNDAPSLYQEFLREHGEGLQHVACWTDRYDEVHAQALAAGLSVGHEGQIGGPSGRFAYYDSPVAGAVLELAEVSGARARLFERIRTAAAGWDGTESVRGR